MRSTFKVLFFLKRDKQKANGNVPLFCRITVDGKEIRFGMKKEVNPKFWDVKAGKATGRTLEATETPENGYRLQSTSTRNPKKDYGKI
jgi:hypothetical protein